MQTSKRIKVPRRQAPTSKPHLFLAPAAANRIRRGLLYKGYAFVKRGDHQIEDQYASEVESFRDSFSELPLDPHLNPGEGQRFRTYGRFILDPQTRELSVTQHQAFFQSSQFDKLYGDIHRTFAPIGAAQLRNQFFLALLVEDFFRFPIYESQLQIPWEISTHLIRIVAVAGAADNLQGRPAPEGIHQDGYHFGVARLFRRDNVVGAESRVHRLDHAVIDKQMLSQPLDALYMNDRAIFHSVEPFVAADQAASGVRDVLISLYQPLIESPQKEGIVYRLDDSGIENFLKCEEPPRHFVHPE